MTNKALFMELIKGYNSLAFTHHYIFGFSYKGKADCGKEDA